ncbi:hypothetical protein CROQUDRAFT_97706 [Cronartium quercuum f. sp. fusiforme G11]|uniref:Uncharacterized protein n=1 Tax=Cronartium quercuum f. sp. fusiforme G11 TaxID=708437 RepID=A0A9P6T7U1_9BASI|nr:hypothetical protein CROQUDRAFT_97706 [Cronartium quercuum f. sp. fusiforme G11]
MLPDEFPGLPALSNKKTKVKHPQKQAQDESPDPNQALQDANSYSDLTSITADEAKSIDSPRALPRPLPP